jgi:hypothetical protein
MTEIKIPDDLAAALQAKAGVQGLTLEEWIRKLADAETSVTQDPGSLNSSEILRSSALS